MQACPGNENLPECLLFNKCMAVGINYIHDTLMQKTSHIFISGKTNTKHRVCSYNFYCLLPSYTPDNMKLKKTSQLPPYKYTQHQEWCAN